MRWAMMLESAPIPASSPDHNKRLTMSFSMSLGAKSIALGRRALLRRVQSAADGLHHQPLGLLVVLLPTRQQSEDPAGQNLLDRAVERDRRELGCDLRLELVVGLRLGHDLGDQ